MPKTLYIVAPRGWCAGVERAIGILDVALQYLAPPIYVRREIVHNKTVVESYAKRGIRFVAEVEEVPAGSAIIFSAHGIAPSVWKQAKKRGLKIIDATCPLVTKVHLEVVRYVREGYHVLYVGHKLHDEAIGVLGEAPDKIHIIETENEAKTIQVPSEKLAVLTQTTLSLDDAKRIIHTLKERFPGIHFPLKEDICYATTNRQNAIKSLIQTHAIELLYVIGSQNSSNSNRLCEVAQSMHAAARLIDTVADIQTKDWQDKEKIGLTAGASAPESLVAEVTNYFKDLEFKVKEVVVEKEVVNFALPKEVLQMIRPQRPSPVAMI